MTRHLRYLAPLLAVFAVPATAQERVVVYEEWVEVVPAENTASRYVSPQHAAVEAAAIAAFGPFRVIDARTVVIVDVTDDRSPAHFSAMIARFPHVQVLEFVEAPGTHDDRANLALGRLIRAHNIRTRVPAGGSVRSGAVELVIAGAIRDIDGNSEFAVHGWLDDLGRGAEDFAPGAPEHRRYLDYYAEMGMSEAQASAFYRMTNSVPFESALWLTGEDMIGWLGESEDAAQAGAEADVMARLDHLDFEPVLQ